MKKLSYFLLITLLWTGCKTASINTHEARISSNDGEVPSVAAFMTDALYNGMMRQQLPKEIVEGLLAENRLFVGKCPICTPTRQGIRDYLSEDGTPKRVNAIEQATLAKLRSSNIEEKQEGFRDLVAVYVKWQHEALGLNPLMDQQLRDRLVAERKVGMSRKSDNFGKFCPSCDGACEVKE